MGRRTRGTSSAAYDVAADASLQGRSPSSSTSRWRGRTRRGAAVRSHSPAGEVGDARRGVLSRHPGEPRLSISGSSTRTTTMSGEGDSLVHPRLFAARVQGAGPRPPDGHGRAGPLGPGALVPPSVDVPGVHDRTGPTGSIPAAATEETTGFRLAFLGWLTPSLRAGRRLPGGDGVRTRSGVAGKRGEQVRLLARPCVAVFRRICLSFFQGESMTRRCFRGSIAILLFLLLVVQEAWPADPYGSMGGYMTRASPSTRDRAILPRRGRAAIPVPADAGLHRDPCPWDPRFSSEGGFHG